VEPLPTFDLVERRLNFEVSLAFLAVEHEDQEGVATVRLVNVELLLGHIMRIKRVKFATAP